MLIAWLPTAAWHSTTKSKVEFLQVACTGLSVVPEQVMSHEQLSVLTLDYLVTLDNALQLAVSAGAAELPGLKTQSVRHA